MTHPHLPLLILTALSLCTACADLPDDEAPVYDTSYLSSSNGINPSQPSNAACTFYYYLRLDDAEGTNLLALADTSLTVQCHIVRQSDKAQMTIEHSVLTDPHLCLTEGPLIHLSWTDMDLLSVKTRPEVYDEAYITQLIVTRHGLSEQHEVSWNLHVSGKRHSVTGCQLDGQPAAPKTLVNVPMITIVLNL